MAGFSRMPRAAITPSHPVADTEGSHFYTHSWVLLIRFQEHERIIMYFHVVKVVKARHSCLVHIKQRFNVSIGHDGHPHTLKLIPSSFFVIIKSQE